MVNIIAVTSVLLMSWLYRW